LAAGLFNRAQLTWGQIKAARREHLGSEQIPRRQIRVPLDPFADSLDFILVFRLSAKWRLLAHREQQVLRLLFVDASHTAY
jgi:hypothetical protein